MIPKMCQELPHPQKAWTISRLDGLGINRHEWGAANSALFIVEKFGAQLIYQCIGGYLYIIIYIQYLENSDLMKMLSMLSWDILFGFHFRSSSPCPVDLPCAVDRPQSRHTQDILRHTNMIKIHQNSNHDFFLVKKNRKLPYVLLNR